MPELPEVETIVSDLRPILVGMSFVSIKSSHNNAVKEALKNVTFINGAKVVSVERRGKFINIVFENDYIMTIHLRMSGRILFRPHDDAELKFERTRINFDKGSLRFCDMRKFGRVWIASKEDYEEVTGIYRLGIEPFSKEMTLENFLNLFTKKKGNVKRWLLDQSMVTGIGNIYADEACFYAGIKPTTNLQDLDKKKLEKLFKCVIKALKQGIENRGTSISDFQDAYGSTGRNQEKLYVYGRGGKKCFNCSSVLIKTKVAGRGTVYCEDCQA